MPIHCKDAKIRRCNRFRVDRNTFDNILLRTLTVSPVTKLNRARQFAPPVSTFSTSSTRFPSASFHARRTSSALSLRYLNLPTVTKTCCSASRVEWPRSARCTIFTIMNFQRQWNIVATNSIPSIWCFTWLKLERDTICNLFAKACLLLQKKGRYGGEFPAPSARAARPNEGPVL